MCCAAAATAKRVIEECIWVSPEAWCAGKPQRVGDTSDTPAQSRRGKELCLDAGVAGHVDSVLDLDASVRASFAVAAILYAATRGPIA
jgi:hypothetical protein